jgi:HTH-type transcriptional regulator/antitoxin HigA
MTALAIRTERWTPDWATHPGEHLAEYIEAQGLSQAEFARLAGLTPKLISTIINRANPVTPDTAIKLERVLGVRANLWTNLQANWDLFHARAKEKAAPETKSWLSQFPLKELKSRGYLPDTKDEGILVDFLLRLFGVGTPVAYQARVDGLAVQHRQSKAHRSVPGHIYTWLMLGERRARAMNLPEFDASRFQQGITEIRRLTVDGPATFEPRMKELCRSAGVALIFEPPISKTCLFGSARWFDTNRAIIQMSLRMKSNDHFWWTFFHEAAHIALHRGRNFLDDENGVGDGAEEEADAWAEEVLVGHDRFAQFKASRPRSMAQVIAFANEIGLHPGIVVGMLQHVRVIPFNHMNELKARFEWASTADPQYQL